MACVSTLTVHASVEKSCEKGENQESIILDLPRTRKIDAQRAALPILLFYRAFSATENSSVLLINAVVNKALSFS